MKWILFLILIGCTDNQDEDMRLLISTLPSTTNQVTKTDYYVIIGGQSIAQGQYPYTQSGYSNAKLTNSNATYLDAKLPAPIWKTYTEQMMSPYQYSYPPPWGCGMEYSLAEYFTNAGKKFNLYKPAWGAQKFGTDAAPGLFNVRADFTPRGSIAVDIFNILTEQKANGITFDYFLWMHGESDGRDALDSRNSYESNLKRFITMVRGIYPDIPFYIRQLPPETESWMGAVIPGGRDAINTSIDNVIEDVENCHLVVMPSPFEQGDLIHPENPEGNDQMALAFWNSLNI